MTSATDFLPLVPDRTAPLGEFAHRLGLVSSACSVIQIDINAVNRTRNGQHAEITLCDHNCTESVRDRPTGGLYTCPAAISLNPGVGSRDLAPADLLIKGLLTTADGARTAHAEFLARDLPVYFREQAIPPRMRPEYTAALQTGHVIVNLFGGSPELHPGCLDIIESLQAEGIEVHLTTTGRRIIREPDFRASLLRRPPQLLAVSADDFTAPDELDAWFALDPAELARLWRSIPAAHGQRRKALEAVQICKLAEGEPLPPLLFNIVLHPGNLARAAELLDRLSEWVPGAVLNPYPVQTAFQGQPGALTADGAQEQLRDFAELAIEAHIVRLLGRAPRWNLAPRFGYWLLLRSIVEDESQPAGVRADRLGGGQAWTCYGRRGAGRCVQIGSGPVSPGKQYAGGHPGCFWNTGTVTHSAQFWTVDASEMAGWILEGRGGLAAAAADPCRGCLFPRMSLDGISLELGMGAAVTPGYRALRSRYLGY